MAHSQTISPYIFRVPIIKDGEDNDNTIFISHEAHLLDKDHMFRQGLTDINLRHDGSLLLQQRQ